MWTQGLEYTWCMWTQWLEYTWCMLFLIFVRLLRQCTPSCSLLKYTYTKLSQLQPWAPAAATSAESTKCLHSRSTYLAGTHAMHTGDDIGGINTNFLEVNDELPNSANNRGALN